MQNQRTIHYARDPGRLELEPRAAALRLPLARLLQLLMMLQSERFPNARRLAEACAVSRRTIYRDLSTLEAAGIDVLYQPEHQGYQLVRDCWLQPTQLEDNEALALLLLSRHACAHAPFGLVRHARTGLAKVVQALPGELRSRLTISGELIPEDSAPPELPPDRQSVHETILSALAHRRRLLLTYREHVQSPRETTRLSLYRLARIASRWSLVGHSSADRKVRILEIARIERIELTDEPYTIPPRFRLERFLENRGHVAPARRHEVRLRFSSHAAPTVRDTPRSRGERLHAGPDGVIDLFLDVEHLDEIVLWVIGFGDQVEVLEPPALKKAVRGWAQRIAQIYSRCDE
jgi:predicted DNA-binding transcriptional regulator YafY